VVFAPLEGTPQILLAYHLKTLKLPTCLREYNKLVRQCASDAVDQVRYLLRLPELELIERERRMIERRIKDAKFPTVKSLDSFDFLAGQGVKHRTNRDLNNRVEPSHRGIKGRYGSMRGFKSHKAAAYFCRDYDELCNFLQPRSRRRRSLRRSITAPRIMEAA
jgi:DNA replication protein DnaC